MTIYLDKQIIVNAEPSTAPGEAGHRSTRGDPKGQRMPVVLPATFIAWVAVVLALAASGWFVVEDGPPLPTIAAVTAPLLVGLWLFRREDVRRYLDSLDPRLVLALQLWRVVGAAFLFGWDGGALDAEFAIPAGVGDIATGLAAFFLLASVLRGTHTRTHVLLFTILGVSDFVVAVITGALVRPAALDALPWIMFPALAVPFFSLIHLLNWRQLVTNDPRLTSAADRRAQNP